MHREMEAHLRGPPNDPTRCVTDCKVYPKGVEPPYCYCQMYCVHNISREYETFGARGIGLVRILRKSKRQVQYHRYRYFFNMFV